MKSSADGGNSHQRSVMFCGCISKVSQFQGSSFRIISFSNFGIQLPVSEYRVSEYQFPNTTVEFPNSTVQFPNTTVTVLAWVHLSWFPGTTSRNSNGRVPAGYGSSTRRGMPVAAHSADLCSSAEIGGRQPAAGESCLDVFDNRVPQNPTDDPCLS